MKEFSPDLYNEYLLRNRKPSLAFDENADYDAWRQQVKEKLTDLLGDMPEEKVPLNIRVEWEKEHDTFIEKRIVFDTEPFASVPCHLWIPKNAKKPCPAVICLQGHATGMHISMGRAIYEAKGEFEGDESLISGGDRDFAVQIVKEGYAALVLEQRAFGERGSEKVCTAYHTTCAHPAMVSLLVGRTLLGGRVWDISRAVDMLEQMPEIDSDRIACMGNSGGGTTTYYAAAMEERIKIAMPSCAVCTFEQSIGIMRHCDCNYLPNMQKYFDMGELACLIAPRKLVVVNGKDDNGFLLPGALDAYDVIRRIYEKAGCKDNCRQVIGEEGHRFYANPSWDVFRELSGWEE